MIKIKRLIGFIILLIVLVGCGSEKGIEDGKFTFTEEEFVKTYEEVNDRNIPDNIDYSDFFIGISEADERGSLYFVNTLNELLDYKEIKRLKESIDKGDGDIPTEIEADDFTLFYIDSVIGYQVSIIAE